MTAVADPADFMVPDEAIHVSPPRPNPLDEAMAEGEPIVITVREIEEDDE